MLAKPKKYWLGSYHPKYGLLEDKEYEVEEVDQKEPMWQKTKGVLIEKARTTRVTKSID